MADRLERIRCRFSYVRCKDAILDRTGFKRYSFPPSRSFPHISLILLSIPLSPLSFALCCWKKEARGYKGTGKPQDQRGKREMKGGGQEEGWRERRTSNSTLYEISSPSSFGTFYPSLFRLLLIMPPLLLFASSHEESRLSFRIDYRETTIQMDKSVFQNILRTLLRNLGCRWSFGGSKNPWQKRHYAIFPVDSRDVSRFRIFGKLIKDRFFLTFWYHQIF